MGVSMEKGKKEEGEMVQSMHLSDDGKRWERKEKVGGKKAERFRKDRAI